MRNVGLAILRFKPRARANPWLKTVLPEPSSPSKAIIVARLAFFTCPRVLENFLRTCRAKVFVCFGEVVAVFIAAYLKQRSGFLNV